MDPKLDREYFENGYLRFITALAVLALDAEEQCQRYGYANVATNLRNDVSAINYAFRLESRSLITAEQKEVIDQLTERLAKLPEEIFQDGASEEGNLTAMHFPEWQPLRERAVKLIEILKARTAENKTFIAKSY